MCAAEVDGVPHLPTNLPMVGRGGGVVIPVEELRVRVRVWLRVRVGVGVVGVGVGVGVRVRVRVRVRVTWPVEELPIGQYY